MMSIAVPGRDIGIARVLLAKPDVVCSVAYAWRMHRQCAAQHALLRPDLEAMVADFASDVIVGTIRFLRVPEEADHPPEASSGAPARFRDASVVGGHQNAFALSKNRASAQARASGHPQVPGAPTAVVMYLDAIPAGVTYSSLHPAYAEAADARLLAARSYLAEHPSIVGSEEAAALLRSPTFHFFGLDDHFQPIRGGPTCGRLITSVERIRQCPTQVSQAAAAVLYKHAELGIAVPLAIQCDVAVLSLAIRLTRLRATAHRAYWVADRMRAVEASFEGSAVATIVGAFAPDGFRRDAPVLDTDLGALVPPAAPPRPSDEDLATIRAVEASSGAGALAQRWQRVVSMIRMDLVSCFDKAQLVAMLGSRAAKTSPLRFSVVPDRVQTLSRALMRGANDGSLRSSAVAVRSFASLTRSLGVCRPLFGFVAATLLEAGFAAADASADARLVSARWGALARLAVVQPAVSAKQGFAAAFSTTTTRRLLRSLAVLVAKYTGRRLREVVDSGLSAKVVMSVVTADLAHIDGSALEAVRSASGGGGGGEFDGRSEGTSIAGVIQRASDRFAAEIETWCVHGAVVGALWQRPLATGILAAGAALDYSGFAAPAVIRSQWNLAAGDALLLDPRTNPAYAPTSRRLLGSGAHGSHVIGASELVLHGGTASTPNSVVMFYTPAQRERLPFMAAHAGAALLMAAAVTPQRTEGGEQMRLPPALSSVMEAIHWPSRPAAIGEFLLPLHSELLGETDRRVEASRRDVVALRIASKAAPVACVETLKREADAAFARASHREERLALLRSISAHGANLTAVMTRLIGEADRFAAFRNFGVDVSLARAGIAHSEDQAAKGPHLGGIDSSLLRDFTMTTYTTTRRDVVSAMAMWAVRRRCNASPDRHLHELLADSARLHDLVNVYTMSSSSFANPIASATNAVVDAVSDIGRRLHLPHLIDCPLRHSPKRVAADRASGASITFDSVCFAYPSAPERCVLDEVSFHVPAGAFAAIVGESGAGKSTVIALLLRIFDPTSGRILVDGVDIRAVPPRQLRRRLGFVGQSCGALPLRIDENLRVGNPCLDLAGQWRALDAAAIRSMVEQRDGQLHARISPTTLSGGEQQRMVLARALGRADEGCGGGVAAFVLDEATSALDVETERKVQAALRTSAVTTIAVAHRLSTVVGSPCVVVMRSGRVVETGSFSALATAGGALAHSVRLQGALSANAAVQLAQRLEGRGVASRRVARLAAAVSTVSQWC